MAGKTTGITKMEAVRRALAELGKDAKPAAIQPWLKEKLGIEMTPGHITVCKGNILQTAGKGKAAAKATASKPAAAPTSATPRPQATAALQQANSKPGGLTKLDAVKQAMAELGPAAMPLAIKDYLKSRLGMEISTDVASTYKKHLRKPAAPKTQVPAAPSVVTATTESAGRVSLKDIGTVKELLGRVGPDGLRSLIDLLAK